MGRSRLYLQGEVRFVLREHSKCHIKADIPDTLFRQNEVDIFSTNTAFCSIQAYLRYTQNSVALVRERTIPTERPPPVGEVNANFCG